jgi:hypothetical protein
MRGNAAFRSHATAIISGVGVKLLRDDFIASFCNVPERYSDIMYWVNDYTAQPFAYRVQPGIAIKIPVSIKNQREKEKDPGCSECCSIIGN